VPRAAVNTSVVWSALAYPDWFNGRIVDSWYAGAYDLVWSSKTIDEYRDILLDPEYLSEFGNETEIQDFLSLVELCGIEVPEIEVDLPVIRDVHDEIWQTVAIGGHADYLVSVDNDFLQEPDLIRQMRTFGVRIVTPRVFLREIDRG